MSEMLIQYLDTYSPEWPRLGYAKPGDAGMDLRAAIDREMVILPGRTDRVPTGIKVALSHQYELQIRPRSGLAAQHAVTVTNAPGTVDAGFRGEIQVLLINHGHEPFRILPGDRIAQAVIGYLPRLDLVEVDALPLSERGEDGFGSTGLSLREEMRRGRRAC